MIPVKILRKIVIYSAWIDLAFCLSQSISKKYSKCKLGQQLRHKDGNGELKLLICTGKINGTPEWTFADGSPTFGEIFNPARDCSDIVDQLPEAKDGFYWIILDKGALHKVWCDVHTDGGGFMLVGMKDSPVTWTVPSNSTPVDPQGPPHWSSVFGDINVLDFRVQFSTDRSFEGSKANWMYRLDPQREFGNLFSINNGCPQLHAGIGNISFVKDLLTKTTLKHGFKCSKFGQHVHHKLGWGKMNYCLRHQCKNGYAVASFFGSLLLRYDNFGSYSYSANFSISGMTHDSTAFVGCDHGKCCACFGPKGGKQNYCGPKCSPINGGKVIKNAFVWFWIRTRMPTRHWKRCMEFSMKNSGGSLEKHFIDLETGVAHKGSCSDQFKTLLNEGTLTVTDKETFKKIPDVPGLLSYRTDNKQLYVNEGSKWEALGTKNELHQLQKELKSQKDLIIDEQKKILHLRNKIQNQDKEYQGIIKRIDKLHLPTSCFSLLMKNPSTLSGWHRINLQGLVASPLVQVYCDMTSKNGVGVTVIGHNSESRTYVKGSQYNDRGSYQRKIKYDISMEQIVAIIKQSKNCEQFIKYECYDSRLFRDGGYGWWVSRQGSKMNYWGGAAVNSGKCACGMTNSCAGGGKCNCDKNDWVWREDSGYLTDKNTLPVTELRFGDAYGNKIGSYYESGYHTLGQLRCWG